jgi:hypothetical protein
VIVYHRILIFVRYNLEYILYVILRNEVPKDLGDNSFSEVFLWLVFIVIELID